MINEYVFRKYFADYVKERLEERGIRIWYAAYYSETDEATYKRYLKTVRLPMIRVLLKTADLLECTVNELLGYERIDIPEHSRGFDSGLDTKHVSKYMAEQVHRRMEELGMNAEELAASVGLQPQVIKDFGKPRSFIDTSILLELCDALGSTPSELLGY